MNGRMHATSYIRELSYWTSESRPGLNLMFYTHNEGKRSLATNLKQEECTASQEVKTNVDKTSRSRGTRLYE